MPRTTQLALLGVADLATVVLAVVLADAWGEQLLAALGAAIVVLLAAHTLRAEQQSRRLHARLTTLEKAVRAGDAKRDLHFVRTRTDWSFKRLKRMEEGFKDPKKFGLLREINAVSRRQYEQVQATLNLFEMVDVEAAVPPMRLWAVSPDALVLLVQEMLEVKPGLVVECGSGVSTLWMALAAKQRGVDTRIVALDHEAEYADKTNRLLRLHGVDDIASARLAPLVDVPSDDGTQPWYDPAVITDLHDIGILFVDGPPATTGPLSRLPAIPQLWDRLAPTASVVVDDFIREDEQVMVDRWIAAHPELTREHHDTEKGTEILRRG
ncbi:class I SAM-dependent methyltransferase [Aeromicrobium sp. NPDC092404]|uniref:class I SAM-dependent methyltransferase n=1 Tax=Aeromicrobium sp. NPDC092404 TaxID=3154976 RepID=UPI003419DD0E